MSIPTNSSDGNKLNPEDILGLLQEMNHQKNLEEGLKVLTRRSLDLFNSAMAGIWLWRDEEFQSLAISTRNSEQERFLNDTVFPADFKMFENNGPGAQECLRRKMILQDIRKAGDKPDGFTGPFSNWNDKLLEFGINRLLCVPLLHFGQLLGVLTLFSSDPDAFGDLSVRWLKQLMPLISSFVYEQQLLLAAWDKEQALTLLLRGTEILVQADSEEQLLTEAGEMAMEILYLEAGFFLLQDGDTLQVRAPFGRLKHNETNWTDEVLKLGNSSESYVLHQNSTLRSTGEDSAGERFPLQWKKILIEPLRTHSGVVGELWLMDSRAKALEQRQEILGAFVRVLGVALETIRQHHELECLASTDRLTGILNRQGFEQRVHEEMAGTSRRDSSFVFLILDLDGFKQLNDTKGHPVGDAALRKLAQNLRVSVREADIVARTGGDEFTLVLTDLKKDSGAINIIERLRENMGLEEYGLGVSIGVAEFPRETSSYEGLYRLADQRLYEGKNSGKGKIVTGD